MLKETTIDKHCLQFAEQRAKSFAQAIKAIQNINPESPQEDKEKQAQKAIASISKDSLTQNQGVLLVEVARLDLKDTVKQLLNATSLWQLDTLKTAVSLNDKQKCTDTTIAILETVNLKHRDFAQLYQTALKSTNHPYKLNHLKEDILGGGKWVIHDDHIISYNEPTGSGIPRVSKTFNFLSRSTRTVVWDREMGTQDVTQRDFHDYQSGDEIDLAYKKLSTIIVNVPDYRGKDDGHQARRIKRQPGNNK